MDGYELARAIRADCGQARPTLIAVTGYGDDKARRASRDAGFDAHLTKPVDVAQLAKLLELAASAR